MMHLNAHIEDNHQVVVHNALEEAAHNVLEPLGQEDMVLEDIVVGAQDLAAVLVEEALAAAEAADTHFSHLLEGQEVHEENLGCSIVQNHVHQLADMDAERAVLQCQPCFKRSFDGSCPDRGQLIRWARGIDGPR